MNDQKLHKKYRDAKSKAKARSIEFSLTFEEYKSIFSTMTCSITGKTLTLKHPSEELRPTVDRITNELGYVAGNVHLVSERMNRLKSDASENEVAQILNYIRKNKNV
jgi:hypothetical protein